MGSEDAPAELLNSQIDNNKERGKEKATVTKNRTEERRASGRERAEKCTCVSLCQVTVRVPSEVVSVRSSLSSLMLNDLVSGSRIHRPGSERPNFS